jgi:hypothetical protein
MTKGFNENRTFGSEFEIGIRRSGHRDIHPDCANYQRSRWGLYEWLAANNVDVATPQGYHHTPTVDGQWKMESDGSIHGQADQVEVITPVLKGREGLAEVKRVLGLISKFGCHINSSMGNHVHQWCGDLNDVQLRNLYNLYWAAQESINSILPASRANHVHCRSLQRSYEDICRWESIAPRTPVSRVLNQHASGHYIALNFGGFVRIGTIEFRQHAGTFNYEKWEAWFLLTQAMIESVKSYTRFPSLRQGLSLDRLFRMIGFSGCSFSGVRYEPSEDFIRARKYIRRRQRHFARQRIAYDSIDWWGRRSRHPSGNR